MPLAVKNAKRSSCPDERFRIFCLMGQHPHTPLTETASQAAHRNRRFMQTGTRLFSASACRVFILFLQSDSLPFHDELLHLRHGKNKVHQIV